MRRSNLENKCCKNRKEANRRVLKKQNNYCNKRGRQKYYSQVNVNNIADNKRLLKTVKPLFINKGEGGGGGVGISYLSVGIK